MAADKEAFDLSRVHMHESKCACPYEIIVYHVVEHIYTTIMPTISLQFIPLISGPLGKELLCRFTSVKSVFDYPVLLLNHII